VDPAVVPPQLSGMVDEFDASFGNREKDEGRIDVHAATRIRELRVNELAAATVAAGAQRIVLVEASPSACADARVNLAGLPAVVVEAKVEDWAPIRAQLVIADPARNGLDKAAAAVLAATHAARIVLVSCDAASLARDARLLVALGYVHRGTEVIDVFPNTSHVEAVTRFDRDSTQIDGHER